MRKFMSYSQATIYSKELNDYINLVDNYKTDSIKTWVIKNYAFTNSISGVIKSARNNLSTDINNITREEIIEILRSKPTDELHKIVRKGYMKKISNK